jgi:hypothetical protein
MSDDRNTCQRAFDLLAARPDATLIDIQGRPPRIEIRRKIAGAGQTSDGTRVFLIIASPNWRWIEVQFGWDTLADVDHRNFWDDPKAMARAVMDPIDHKCLTYRTELTPAGEQMIIPGCERDAAPGVRQLSLF